MIRNLAISWAVTAAFSGSVQAGSDDFQLSATAPLTETGLLDYLLPRFSLKTGVGIDRAPGGAVLGDAGVPVFEGAGQVWLLETAGLAGAERFLDWLTSDIGKRTVAAFPGAAFETDFGSEDMAVIPEISGDVALGSEQSLTWCGRCHVVDTRNRMDGLGSTPSFAVLRTFPDWQARFETFYVLAPHAAFTQIEGVTAPFDPALPSPIAPMELTLDDLEAIIAFTAGIEPADLGGPVPVAVRRRAATGTSGRRVDLRGGLGCGLVSAALAARSTRRCPLAADIRDSIRCEPGRVPNFGRPDIPEGIGLSRETASPE